MSRNGSTETPNLRQQLEKTRKRLSIANGEYAKLNRRFETDHELLKKISAQNRTLSEENATLKTELDYYRLNLGDQDRPATVEVGLMTDGSAPSPDITESADTHTTAKISVLQRQLKDMKHERDQHRGLTTKLYGEELVKTLDLNEDLRREIADLKTASRSNEKILAEREGEIRELKRRLESTRAEKSGRDGIVDQERNALRREVEGLKGELEARKNEVVQKVADLEASQAEVKRQAAANETTREKNADLLASLHVAQANIEQQQAEHEDVIAHLRDEIDDTKRRLREAEEQREAVSSRAETLAEQVTEMEALRGKAKNPESKTLPEKTREIADLKSQIIRMQETAAAKAAEFEEERKQLQEEVRELKRQFQDRTFDLEQTILQREDDAELVDQERNALRREVEGLKSELEARKNEVVQKVADLEASQAEVKRQAAANETTREKNADLLASLHVAQANIEQQQAEHEDVIAHLRDEIDDTKRRLREAEEQREAVSSRAETLAEQVTEMEALRGKAKNLESKTLPEKTREIADLKSQIIRMQETAAAKAAEFEEERKQLQEEVRELKRQFQDRTFDLEQTILQREDDAELVDQERNALRREVEGLKSELEARKNEVVQKVADLEASQAEVKRQAAANETTREKNADLLASLHVAQANIEQQQAEHEDVIAHLRDEIDDTKRRLREAEEQREAVSSRAETLAEQVTEMEALRGKAKNLESKTLPEKTREIADLKSQIIRMQETAAAKAAEFEEERKQLQEEVRELKRQFQDRTFDLEQTILQREDDAELVDQERNALRREVEGLKSELEARKNEVVQKVADLEASQAEVKRQAAANETTREKNADLLASLHVAQANIEQQQAEHEDVIAHLRDEIDDTKRRLREAEEQREAVSSRAETLAEQVTEMEALRGKAKNLESKTLPEKTREIADLKSQIIEIQETAAAKAAEFDEERKQLQEEVRELKCQFQDRTFDLEQTILQRDGDAELVAQERNALRREVEGLKSELEARKNEVVQKVADLEASQAEVKRQAAANETTREKNADLLASLHVAQANIEQQQAEHEDVIAHLRDEIDDTKRRLREAEEQREAVSSRAETLAEQVTEMEALRGKAKNLESKTLPEKTREIADLKSQIIRMQETAAAKAAEFEEERKQLQEEVRELKRQFQDCTFDLEQTILQREDDAELVDQERNALRREVEGLKSELEARKNEVVQKVADLEASQAEVKRQAAANETTREKNADLLASLHVAQANIEQQQAEHEDVIAHLRDEIDDTKRRLREAEEQREAVSSRAETLAEQVTEMEALRGKAKNLESKTLPEKTREIADLKSQIIRMQETAAAKAAEFEEERKQLQEEVRELKRQFQDRTFDLEQTILQREDDAELVDQERNALRREVEGLKSELEARKNEVVQKVADLEASQAEVKRQAAANETTREKNADLLASLHVAQANIEQQQAEHEDVIAHLRDEIDDTKRRLREAEEQREAVSSRAETLAEQVTEMEALRGKAKNLESKTLPEKTREIADLKSQIIRMQETAAAKAAEFEEERKQLQEEVRELKRQFQDCTFDLEQTILQREDDAELVDQERNALRREVEGLKGELEARKNEVVQKVADLEASQAEVKRQAAANETTREKNADLLASLHVAQANIEQQQAEHENVIAHLRDEIDDTKRRLREAEEQREAVSSRAETLAEQVTEMEALRGKAKNLESKTLPEKTREIADLKSQIIRMQETAAAKAAEFEEERKQLQEEVRELKRQFQDRTFDLEQTILQREDDAELVDQERNALRREVEGLKSELEARKNEVVQKVADLEASQAEVKRQAAANETTREKNADLLASLHVAQANIEQQQAEHEDVIAHLRDEIDDTKRRLREAEEQREAVSSRAETLAEQVTEMEALRGKAKNLESKTLPEKTREIADLKSQIIRMQETAAAKAAEFEEERKQLQEEVRELKRQFQDRTFDLEQTILQREDDAELVDQERNALRREVEGLKSELEARKNEVVQKVADLEASQAEVKRQAAANETTREKNADLLASLHVAQANIEQQQAEHEDVIAHLRDEIDDTKRRLREAEEQREAVSSRAETLAEQVTEMEALRGKAKNLESKTLPEKTREIADLKSQIIRMQETAAAKAAEFEEERKQLQEEVRELKRQFQDRTFDLEQTILQREDDAELVDQERNALRREVEGLKSELEARKNEVVQKVADLEASQAEVKRQAAANETTREKNADLLASLHVAQANIEQQQAEHEDVIAHLRDEIDDTKRRLREAEEQREAVSSRAETLAEQVTEMEALRGKAKNLESKTLPEKTREIADLKSQIIRMQETAAAKAAEFEEERKQLQEEVRELKRQFQDRTFDLEQTILQREDDAELVDQERNALRREVEGLKSELEARKNEVVQKVADLEASQAEVKRQAAANETTREKNADLLASLHVAQANIEQQQAEHENVIAHLRDEIDDTKRRLREAEEQREAVSSRAETLAEQVTEMEALRGKAKNLESKTLPEKTREIADLKSQIIRMQETAAAKAAEFEEERKQLQEEVRELKCQFQDRTFDLEQTILQRDGDAELVAQERNALRREVEGLKSELEARKNEVVQKVADLEASQAEVKRQAAANETTREKSADLLASLHVAQANIEQQQAEHENVIAHLRDEIDDTKRRLREAEEQREAVSSRAETLAEQVTEMEALRGKAKNLESKTLPEKTREIADLKSQIIRMQETAAAKAAEFEEERKQLQEEVRELKRQFQDRTFDLEQTILQREDDAELVDQERNALRREVEGLKSELEARKNEVVQKVADLEAISADLQAVSLINQRQGEESAEVIADLTARLNAVTELEATRAKDLAAETERVKELERIVERQASHVEELEELLASGREELVTTIAQLRDENMALISAQHSGHAASHVAAASSQIRALDAQLRQKKWLRSLVVQVETIRQQERARGVADGDAIDVVVLSYRDHADNVRAKVAAEREVKRLRAGGSTDNTDYLMKRVEVLERKLRHRDTALAKLDPKHVSSPFPHDHTGMESVLKRSRSGDFNFSS
ncbi:hypothetical protein J8273_5076 [Carpediemonas membranifera]|uniref:Uncharacterized protein n=1 Tax=Carpediemonas membranifera TaxID=201153 RepID=A0A8J6AZD2_9EUKA|nr:hypothetical protein J8273_5076 [Carpediemonas membranifera]|eukprot:KAG9392103.1 hypothetical protein J8273_5076 [Carpediemonas membranifera]